MARLDVSESGQCSTDSQLIRLVKAQDSEGWRQLVRIYTPLVRYWMRCGIRLEEADREDILQEVFLRIARTIANFQPDGNPASFRRWTASISPF